MKIHIVVEAYKGCIEAVHAFTDKEDAAAKEIEIRESENFTKDEDDTQTFEVDIDTPRIVPHISLSLSPQVLKRMQEQTDSETMMACDGQTYFDAQREPNGDIRLRITGRTKIEKELEKVKEWVEPHFEDVPGLEKAWNTIRSRAE